MAGWVRGGRGAGAMFSVRSMDDKAVARRLRRLPLKVATRVLRRAVGRSWKPVKEIAKGLAPVRTGALVSSIRVSTKGKPRKGWASASVVPGKSKAYTGDTYYAAFQELGTDYQEAQPFLRPAMKRGGDVAVRRLGNELGRAIVEEARKR